MKIVLDASAACEIVLQRAKAYQFGDIIRKADEVIAPELYIVEVANALWKYIKMQELDLEHAQKCLEAAIDLIDRIAPASELIHEALVTSSFSKHPVYDMIYLILARRNGSHLLSLDRKLITLAQKNGVSIVET